MPDPRCLTCFLLVISVTGICTEDTLNRDKRSEDLLKKAMEASQDLLSKTSQLLKDAGLDISSLPQNLQQMASQLFQMSGPNNTIFQNILDTVKTRMDEKMGKPVDIATIREKYNQMLVNPDFMKEVSSLMQETSNKPDDPNFKSGMEGILAKYMEKALGRAGGLAASLVSLVLALVVYIEFVF
ncbi:hypothetical protein ACOMHN_066960 [Nucella lapillus]